MANAVNNALIANAVITVTSGGSPEGSWVSDANGFAEAKGLAGSEIVVTVTLAGYDTASFTLGSEVSSDVARRVSLNPTVSKSLEFFVFLTSKVSHKEFCL